MTADWSEQFAEARPNVELHLEESGHELFNVVDKCLTGRGRSCWIEEVPGEAPLSKVTVVVTSR